MSFEMAPTAAPIGVMVARRTVRLRNATGTVIAPGDLVTLSLTNGALDTGTIGSTTSIWGQAIIPSTATAFLGMAFLALEACAIGTANTFECAVFDQAIPGRDVLIRILDNTAQPRGAVVGLTQNQKYGTIGAPNSLPTHKPVAILLDTTANTGTELVVRASLFTGIGGLR
jgi:hypothetical protein